MNEAHAQALLNAVVRQRDHALQAMAHAEAALELVSKELAELKAKAEPAK